MLLPPFAKVLDRTEHSVSSLRFIDSLILSHRFIATNDTKMGWITCIRGKSLIVKFKMKEELKK